MKKTWIFVLMVLFTLGVTSCTEQLTDIGTTEDSIESTEPPITDDNTQTTETPTTESITQSTEVPTTENITQTTEIPTTVNTPTTNDVTTVEPTTVDPITTNPTTEEVTTVEIVELRDSYFQYSTNSTQNILLLHLDITDDVQIYDTNDELLNKDDILVKNDYYEIKSSYILSLEEELVEFYLVFDNQKTLISISVSDKDIPYIISSSLVYTGGSQDLKFQFEIFNGTVEQVNANDLESSDYTIDHNILTINQSFVSDTFNDSNQFIISYSLEGSQLVIGMITINQE